MPWGKKSKADEEEHPPEDGLKRTCHICGQPVDSRVWYAKTIEDEKGKRPDQRVYACPPCYFDLEEGDRGGYYRERL